MTEKKRRGRVEPGPFVARVAKAFMLAGPVGLVAGCGLDSGDTQGVTYCVDPYDEVVNPAYCDTGDGHGTPYYIFVDRSPTTYVVGGHVPSSAGQRVIYSDGGARQGLGVSAKGTPKTGVGTIARGGIGSGSGGGAKGSSTGG